jgi:hypothetical protein
MAGSNNNLIMNATNLVEISQTYNAAAAAVAAAASKEQQKQQLAADDCNLAESSGGGKLPSHHFSTASAAATTVLNTAGSEMTTMLSNMELLTNDLDNNNMINLSNQNLNKFDDDEDYSMLPNDIIEFNSMNDLVDYFKSNDRQQQQHPAAGLNINETNTASESYLNHRSNIVATSNSLLEQLNIFKSNPDQQQQQQLLNQPVQAQLHQQQQQQQSTSKFIPSDFGWLVNNTMKFVNQSAAHNNNDSSLNSEDNNISRCYLQGVNFASNNENRVISNVTAANAAAAAGAATADSTDQNKYRRIRGLV